MEVWKFIEGSLGYEVSNIGRVRRQEHKRWNVVNNSYSTYKEKLIVLSNNNSKKYWRVKIYYKDKNVTESVHRLVATAFIKNPLNLPQVNHIDGNRNNNSVENLEWVTNLENMRHSLKIGLRDACRERAFGEGSNLNKYSKELILKIPETVIRLGSYTKAAKELGIPNTLITEIKAGRAWPKLNIYIPDTVYCKRYSPTPGEIQAKATNHAMEI